MAGGRDNMSRAPEVSRRGIPGDRDKRGLFQPGNSLAGPAGRATRGKLRLSSRLGLRGIPQSATFSRYQLCAKTFRRAQCAILARKFGVCGPAPSALVANAALALAWSRFYSDQAALAQDGSKRERDQAGYDVDRAGKLMSHCAAQLKLARELAAAEADAQEFGLNHSQALVAALTGGR